MKTPQVVVLSMFLVLGVACSDDEKSSPDANNASNNAAANNSGGNNSVNNSVGNNTSANNSANNSTNNQNAMNNGDVVKSCELTQWEQMMLDSHNRW